MWMQFVWAVVGLGTLAAILLAVAKVKRERVEAAGPAPDAKAVEVPECAGCGAPNPRHAPPCLVPVRSMVDGSFWDDFLLHVGVRREVRYAVSVVRDIDVLAEFCPHCSDVARAVCEKETADIIAGRAKQAQAEATRVAKFGAFAMHDAVRAEVSEQRERRTKEQRAAKQTRPTNSNGTNGYVAMSNGQGAAS